MHGRRPAFRAAAIAAVLSPLLLSACSFFDVVNAFAPSSSSSLQSGVAYGNLPRQKLDLYRPRAPDDDAAIIIFFYGGGWDSGQRTDYEFVGRKLAAKGYFVVIPDYRLYPDVVFPEFVNDGAMATAYILERVREITGHDADVFLMGHSAGAHIAMLVAMDDRYLARNGHLTDRLAGIIGLAGPYDFLPIESARLQKIFPTSQAQRASQPIHFVDSNDPPVFLGHGDQDRRVWLKNSVNMAATIKQQGNAVTFKVYPGLSHTGIMRPFIPFMKDSRGVLDDVTQFISDQH